jgi:hypothetical protein
MSTIKTLLLLAGGYAAIQIIGGKKHNTNIDPPTNTNVVDPDKTYYKGYEIETFPLMETSYGYSISKKGAIIPSPKNGGYQSVKAAILAAESFIDKMPIPLNGLDISKIA